MNLPTDDRALAVAREIDTEMQFYGYVINRTIVDNIVARVRRVIEEETRELHTKITKLCEEFEEQRQARIKAEKENAELREALQDWAYQYPDKHLKEQYERLLGGSR